MSRLVVLSLIVFAVSNLEAALYKGQKEFIKRCSRCHTNGQAFISKKSSAEWEEYMKNNADELMKVHLNTGDTQKRDSYDYFKNGRVEKNSNHLLQFLIEYSKDSGNVPACN